MSLTTEIKVSLTQNFEIVGTFWKTLQAQDVSCIQNKLNRTNKFYYALIVGNICLHCTNTWHDSTCNIDCAVRLIVIIISNVRLRWITNNSNSDGGKQPLGLSGMAVYRFAL